MPLTIKRSRPKVRVITEDLFPEDSDSSNSSTKPNFKELLSFQKQWNAADSYPLKYRTVVAWWPKACVAGIPEAHIEVLAMRIGYELQAKAYGQAVMPESVIQNLKAMRELRVDRMTPPMRRMMEISIKTTQQGEEEMGKKAANKSVRQGVSQFYLEIFEAQAKAQLNDVQIVEAIEKKTGVKPSAKNVASYRCMYNAGKLEGQKGVPSPKVKAVRPKSDKPAKAKKPMSEETKAKLKAYSAKKKLKKAKAMILPKGHPVHKILKKVKD